MDNFTPQPKKQNTALIIIICILSTVLLVALAFWARPFVQKMLAGIPDDNNNVSITQSANKDDTNNEAYGNTVVQNDSQQSYENLYNKACALLSNGSYDEALAIFTDLYGYQNSAEMIKETNYQKASNLLKNWYAKEALAIFQTLRGYKDSDALAIKAQEAIDAANPKNVYEVGKTVRFGSYEQNAEWNSSEPIEWIVVDRDGNLALLVSKYALNAMPYNTTDTYTTWGTSSLRSWLGNTFYNTAFNQSEKNAIYHSYVIQDSNPHHGTYGGESTRDYVFILSYSELLKYYDVLGGLQLEPTVYAKDYCGAIMGKVDHLNGNPGYTCWWVRTPGSDNCRAVDVLSNGSVNYKNGIYLHCKEVAVRPAMWVNTTIAPK